ncbi:hypothetical protein ANN_12062 [Periplaneta americana]|uniref:Spo11/DNA topoisomerase VI subunit A N-terminal domain-containing protein n=1 Tax=Periplaneta americana TaxID=6978 RepID=A0ABQ8T6U4_PERAM|nr:hypothetical protein ANN_12062 [Periplaneta americana]
MAGLCEGGNEPACSLKAIWVLKEKKDREKRRSELMGVIEGLLLDVVRSVAEDRPPALTLRDHSDWNNVMFQHCLQPRPGGESSTLQVNFGASRSRAKFSLLVHLLGVVHRLLLTGASCTRRQLYYQNVALVRSQRVLDAAMRDVCCLLAAPAWDLGVGATSKGLVAGPLLLCMEHGDVIDCSTPGGQSGEMINTKMKEVLRLIHNEN